jgi:hypothetical protein
MPNTATNPEQAVVEYELLVPDSRPIVLSSGVVNHDHSVLHDTVFGMSEYTHRLRTIDTGFVDNQIKQAMASGTPRFRFRLGVGSPVSTFWLPWQEHVIVRYPSILESLGEQAGHSVELVTRDLMYLMTRGNKVAARKGTISEIVTGIATAAGFKDTVIEGTVGKGIYIQSFEDDVAFINKRLIQRAKNSKARGNYLFYFKDNSLHFHSSDYQAQLHNVVYYRANAAALSQIDSSQGLLNAGAASTEMIAYDLYSGNTTVVRNDPKKVLKLSDSVYQIDKIPGVEAFLHYHNGVNFAEEAETIGQNAYESAHSKIFSLILEVDKTIQIRHGDFVNLIVTPSDSKASPWSGYYLVSDVKHVIQKGAVRSAYTLMRGEIKKSLKNLTVTSGKNILINEQTAPGQPLNISEIKSSQQTKGAGKLAADGKLFSVVQRPNTV